LKVSAFLACDWGGTNLRAWVVGDTGEVLDRRDFPFGISRLQPGEAPARFDADVRPALAAEDLPAILCGMVGSNLGWRAVPYLDCPVDLATLGHSLCRVRDGATPVWIVPGLRGDGPTAAPDFMRGEETQIAGWLETQTPRDRRALCLPGTHAKWVVLDDQRLTRVTTFMTGELYAVLSRHSVLRTEAPVDDEAAFDAGLAAAGDGGGLAARLFSTRARVVAAVQPATPESSASYLSGLLIGAEVAAAPALAGLDPDEPLALLGDPRLCRWYARALSRTGRAFETFDGDRAVLAGLTALYRAGPGQQA
jgi:2-dehydro-3-deoxygalactonokinase